MKTRFAPNHGTAALLAAALLTASTVANSASPSSCRRSFTTELKLASDAGKVLVYGRRVNDLRTVDYDVLSMLDISATRELAKKVAALEAGNARLKAANEQLSELSSEMAAPKQAVAALRTQADGTVTVSTAK